MEDTIKRLAELGLDTESGMAYTGGAERYIAAIARYVGSAERNVSDIAELMGSGDLRGFMTAVHAVKSNSKMIGHTELYGAFERLEAAAANGDTAYIAENCGKVLEKYRGFAQAAKPFIPTPESPAAAELSADEAAETAGRLLAALDDFDDELSAELVKKLSGYPFGGADRERLAAAERYIGEFMYDEAAAVIGEIIPAIKDKTGE